jgi:hypothetical protein
MNLSDARQAYYDYSGKLSDLIEKLNYAGIGIIWILKFDNKTGISFSGCLLWALGLLYNISLLRPVSIFLCFMCLGIVSQKKEITETREDEIIAAPRTINWPTIFFFWGKAVYA